jgi:hypothetical protein
MNKLDLVRHFFLVIVRKQGIIVLTRSISALGDGAVRLDNLLLVFPCNALFPFNYFLGPLALSRNLGLDSFDLL